MALPFFDGDGAAIIDDPLSAGPVMVDRDPAVPGGSLAEFAPEGVTVEAPERDGCATCGDRAQPAPAPAQPAASVTTVQAPAAPAASFQELVRSVPTWALVAAGAVLVLILWKAVS